MPHDRPIAAAGAVFAAMFLLGLIDNTVVVIARDLGLWQFHFMRAVIVVGLMGGMSALGLIHLRPNRRWAVALRGGLAGFSMLIYFGCLAFMPIGQVAAGLFTAPIWVMLIGALFLGQPIGLTRLIAALVGFAGVLLVLNPFADGLDPVAVIPVTAGFFYAIGGIATREWCHGESTFSMLLYFFLSLGLFGLIGTTALTLFPQDAPLGPEGFILRALVWPTPLAMGLTLLQAGGSMIAMGLIFRGYQLGEASQVAIFEYSMLIFAAGWSFSLFGTTLEARAALGMVLIIASGILIAIRSRR
ncbi:DMT family transporter [Aliiroseovarius subalbicans]|uniref:DMT family transporter n=1 Tax=Aliiroseovarius subalbicans TaxID=2925840 RepID=UPI001F563D67|nr:DMT family transporter [Aliiroseovarius subalbicans]MCI2399185.1 DMT family transporter [Aliiroseovarius subalbicans]